MNKRHNTIILKVVCLVTTSTFAATLRSAKLLKQLAERQDHLKRHSRCAMWVFWVGDDESKFRKWMADQKIPKLTWGVASPDLPALKAWKLHEMAQNTFVLSNRRDRTVITTFSDIRPQQFELLEKMLAGFVDR